MSEQTIAPKPATTPRIGAEALEPVEPDDPNAVRRRPNLGWAATAAHERCGHESPHRQRECLPTDRMVNVVPLARAAPDRCVC